jgi:hypothetical protein
VFPVYLLLRKRKKEGLLETSLDEEGEEDTEQHREKLSNTNFQEGLTHPEQ